MSSGLFLLDDVTPFGIDRTAVENLVRLLREPQCMLNAEDQARLLFELIPKTNAEIVSVGYGGALVYALLAREGLEVPFTMLNAERSYAFIPGQKRPEINCSISGNPDLKGYCTPILLDDVIASGQTMYYSRAHLDVEKANAATLVMSGDTRSSYRLDFGSSVSGIDTAYASQVAMGVGGFPAILSLRFVLLKTEESGNLNYLIRYAREGAEQELKDLLRSRPIDIEQLRLLYRNPAEFVMDQTDAYR